MGGTCSEAFPAARFRQAPVVHGFNSVVRSWEMRNEFFKISEISRGWTTELKPSRTGGCRTQCSQKSWSDKSGTAHWKLFKESTDGSPKVGIFVNMTLIYCIRRYCKMCKMLKSNKRLICKFSNQLDLSAFCSKFCFDWCIRMRFTLT